MVDHFHAQPSNYLESGDVDSFSIANSYNSYNTYNTHDDSYAEHEQEQEEGDNHDNHGNGGNNRKHGNDPHLVKLNGRTYDRAALRTNALDKVHAQEAFDIASTYSRRRCKQHALNLWASHIVKKNSKQRIGRAVMTSVAGHAQKRAFSAWMGVYLPMLRAYSSTQLNDLSAYPSTVEVVREYGLCLEGYSSVLLD